MGDKWTTSGAWRLKAKQNRSFAARGSHHIRHHVSSVIIDTTKNQPANSTGNLNSALYRPRNAGGKVAIALSLVGRNKSDAFHFLLTA